MRRSGIGLGHGGLALLFHRRVSSLYPVDAGSDQPHIKPLAHAMSSMGLNLDAIGPRPPGNLAGGEDIPDPAVPAQARRRFKAPVENDVVAARRWPGVVVDHDSCRQALIFTASVM